MLSSLRRGQRFFRSWDSEALLSPHLFSGVPTPPDFPKPALPLASLLPLPQVPAGGLRCGVSWKWRTVLDACFSRAFQLILRLVLKLLLLSHIPMLLLGATAASESSCHPLSPALRASSPTSNPAPTLQPEGMFQAHLSSPKRPSPTYRYSLPHFPATPPTSHTIF